MEETNNKSSSPIYVDLASESDDPTVTQIESLCLQCHEMGITRLLMTRIPHFREIILTSFECEKCGNRNNGVQSATTQPTGITYLLEVCKTADLSRQIVVSEHASVSIPELEFEIPPNGEKGEVTNIESVIKRTLQNLEQDQPVRRHLEPDVAAQIDLFISKLNKLLTVSESFHFKIDDPSGNSFLENPSAPLTDPHLTKTLYERTKEQNLELGISAEDSTGNKNQLASVTEEDDESEEKASTKQEDLRNEVLTFSTLCEKCSSPVQTNMKVTNVPNFKEVIIMATCCDNCGYRTNEVKSGSGMSAKGHKIILKIDDPTIDLSRDVLKSDTCSIKIPELEIDVGAGIFGGKFTTVEGLITDIKEDLAKNPFLCGDSVDHDTRSKFTILLQNIDEVLSGEKKVTLELNDPAGNSYIQNVYTPDVDPRLKIEEYERSFEQNEELGLNDMKTENYTEDS